MNFFPCISFENGTKFLGNVGKCYIRNYIKKGGEVGFVVMTTYQHDQNDQDDSGTH